MAREHTSEFRPKRGRGYYQMSMKTLAPRKCTDCPAMFTSRSATAKRCDKCRKARGNNGRWV